MRPGDKIAEIAADVVVKGAAVLPAAVAIESGRIHTSSAQADAVPARPTIKGRLKEGLAGTLGIIALIVLPIVLVLAFVRGALWLTENVLPWVIAIAWIALAVDIVILLPLAAFQRLRPHCAGLIYLSSFLFGTVLWFIGFLTTYALW